MKKAVKALSIAVVFVLSMALLSACELGKSTPKSDYGVVRAFNAVTPDDDIVTKTAVADKDKYLVTVITSSAVVNEYIVDAEFNVGEASVLASAKAAFGDENLSDFERAYSEALRLSGIDKSEVLGFDFDIDTYMGERVYKVEIEDATVEHTYILRISDLELLSTSTEFNGRQPADPSFIGDAEAKKIALDAMGIAEKDVSNLVVKSATVEKMYMVRFDYNGFRYSVDIDAVSGDVVKCSQSILSESGATSAKSGLISEDEAKDIAVGFVFPNGAGEAEVRFYEIKLDYEKGEFVYEVEFSVDGIEYELEIAASSGKVLDADIDNDKDYGERLPQGNTPTGTPTDEFITKEQAIEAVKQAIGKEVTIYDIDIEKEIVNSKVRYFYEIEVGVDGRKVEYYVDAISGEVTAQGEHFEGVTKIGEDEALAIALERFELTEDKVTNIEVKLEEDDGRYVYEIEFMVGSVEYSADIDALTGNILESEIDRN